MEAFFLVQLTDQVARECHRIVAVLAITVETGLLVHALMGPIAELYALLFENALKMQ